MTKNQAYQEVYCVSSGTLAALSGRKTYAEIEALQQRIFQWIERQPNKIVTGWETWQDIWATYQAQQD